MTKIERFEVIEAWKLARELTKLIYQITSVGDFARDFGLKDQIRRAAVSIVSDIAEGYERDKDKEFLQFLAMAQGSGGEVRAQLYVALDQADITAEQFKAISPKAVEISRLLSEYLRQSDMRGSKYR